ncbi:restriction endonuclease subunit S [Colwellia sp. E2M01]|uniref:restriction endonuclease subunit S n=1 Tax=Colwellia sp. E2M01 TaxID=2841561 RepID=UPI001C0A40E1|nr:restriction endonuclease subunit S [Colwellia sp. E2M01]
MSWPMVKLGELVTIKGGGTPSKKIEDYWNGSIPWASVKDLKENEISKTQDAITELGVSNSATNIIPAGTILTATRMALGKFAINTVDMAINQDLKALFINDEEKVDRDFLIRFLESKAQYIDSEGKGATVKGITLDFLKSLEIPLPPLDEQKRIAAILDKADAIRRKRQQAINLADDFLRSVFLDMFGDPVTNPKGWQTTVLKVVAPAISTKNVSISNDEKIWLLNLDAVEAQTGKILKELSIPLNEVGSSTNHFDSSHVLYSKLRPYLNKVVIPNKPGMATSELITLKPDLKQLTREFLASYLRSDYFVNWAKTKVAGAKMPRLSTAELWKHEIYLPPINLQLKFVALFTQVNELKKKNEISKHDTENGFNSLSQKAFAGEL